MKKVIALSLLAGLLAVGCARDKDINRGGTSDQTDQGTGTGKMKENADPSATPDSSTSPDSSKSAPQQ